MITGVDHILTRTWIVSFLKHVETKIWYIIPTLVDSKFVFQNLMWLRNQENVPRSKGVHPYREKTETKTGKHLVARVACRPGSSAWRLLAAGALGVDHSDTPFQSERSRSVKGTSPKAPGA